MRHYKVKPIQSLERGLHVLAKLREMRAASLHDLHRATGIPKPTLTRILYTL
jgi:IclR family mhp operon transcriptional activator